MPAGERFERLAELFERAEAEDPSAVLAEARASDPALASELERLLSASAAEAARDDDRFERIVGVAAGWLGERAVDAEGDPRSAARSDSGRVGPYRILGELGRGGLGTVYLAERADEGFPLRVALKMVDRRFGSARERERLIEERRILASLDHPNIARVLDAGTAPDGAPYFALELIQGEPIDRHCDRLRLPVRARVELFLGVCDAVAFAHRRLVIHRDVKPSNVLVSDLGAVKLLDFGIAKVLGDVRDAGLTQPGERFLTPEFASPEQARGEALTTATDVYSLGALLYTLLAGRAPLPLAGLPAAEMERRLGTETPAPPSAAATAGPGAAEIAERRRTTSTRLRREIAGDLDTIVAQALRKEPARRTSSVEQLAEDLRRHLDGRPIAARADSLTYRTRRFVGRHRTAVAAAALVVLSLAAGLASTVRQMRRARLEQARTERVAAFLVGLFEAVDPSVARGAEPTAREILDRGARDLLAGRAAGGGPEVQATLAGTVGRVYLRLGHYDEAERLLARALALRQSLDDPTAVASALVDLGQLHDDRREYAAAVAELRRALAIQDSALPAGDPERARTLYRLASVELGRGDPAAAEALLAEALALRLGAYGARSLEVAEVRQALGQVYFRTGRWADAARAFGDVLALRRTLLGDDHPAVLSTQNDLASARFELGDTAGALALLERTVALRRAVLGADHPHVARSLLNLAAAARKADDLPRARRAAREALDISRRAFGDDHPRTAEALAQLGKVERARGELPEAERLLREALAIERRRLGPAHVEVARTLLDLALAVRDQGRRREAEALLFETVRTQEAALGADDPALSYALVPLGQLLVESGRAAAAEPHLRRALALREKAFPADHPRRSEAQGELGLCLCTTGRTADGAALLAAAARALPGEPGRRYRDASCGTANR